MTSFYTDFFNVFQANLKNIKPFITCIYFLAEPFAFLFGFNDFQDL